MIRWRSFFGVSFLGSLLFTVFLFYKAHNQTAWIDPFDVYRPDMLTSPPKRRQGSEEPVTVLLYNLNLVGDQHWTGWGQGDQVWQTPNYVGYPVTKQNCPIDCIVSADRSLLGAADAVVFEGTANEELLWDWLRVPLNLPQKRPGQYWVNFGFDNPDHYPLLNHAGYMIHFDINMTYNQEIKKSQVPISLFCNWAGGDKDDFLKPAPPKTNEKLVAFLMHDCSHGRGKKAVTYVKNLMKYIKVDSYGKCLHNVPDEPICPQSVADHGLAIAKELQIYSQYKFVLTFEISNLTDFVTEKLALALKAGSVPVYHGAPNVDNWIPGDRSIIKIADFASPKELADYLTSLSSDDSEYNKYFAWKKRGLSMNFHDKLDKCIFQGADCRLCQTVSRLQQIDPYTAHGNQVITDRSFALSFDGSSTYVEIGDFEELRLEDGYTLAAWIYMDKFEDYRVIDKNTAGQVDGYSMDILKKGDRGFLRLCTSGGCWMGMKPLSAGNWYHVSVVFISSLTRIKGATPGIDFYINGQHDHHAILPKNQFGIGFASKNNLPLRIGRAGNGAAYWPGMIDDVSIWNVPLSQAKIARLMYTRLGGNEFGLVGYWSFNEGAGNIVYDYSKGRHHGKINSNNVNWVPSETKELVLHKCV